MEIEATRGAASRLESIAERADADRRGRLVRTRALATNGGQGHAVRMTVVPMPPRGEWFADARDGDRALRVSWHAERGCVVLSTWRADACVGTIRLTGEDAARLIGALANGLAVSATAPEQQEGTA